MLKIGFANKYFTLWNVTNEKAFSNCGGIFLPYNKTNFNFIRNLSMNEEDALKKAVLLGVECLDIDDELRGKSGSFSVRETFPKVDTVTSFVYEFGKYKGQGISATHEEEYLFWYFQETQNVHAKKILINQFGFVDFEGQLISLEHFNSINKRQAVLDQIRKEKKSVGQMVSNLDAEGVGRIEIDGQIVHVYFPEWKLMSYNGFEYGLPAINGKGKKIKNEFVEIEVSEKDGNNFDFQVEKFTIIKEQIIY